MMKRKLHYIEKRISEGEHLNQDFKYAINDSKKIARSLAAFANTKGGRLLIGVKDNGNITGVKTDEEFYMIEAAADLYCKPPVKFSRKDWLIGDKKVLEIIIPESTIKPHLAENEEKKWKAYIRVADEIVLANIVYLKVWNKTQSSKGIKIKGTDDSRLLLKCIKLQQKVSLSELMKLNNLSYYKCVNLLANFVSIGLIHIIYENNTFYYIPAAED